MQQGFLFAVSSEKQPMLVGYNKEGGAEVV
jgi:hypothetical protein